MGCDCLGQGGDEGCDKAVQGTRVTCSISTSSSFSRSSSARAWSSMKKRGTGTSSTEGGSFRSTSTSSKLMKTTLLFSSIRSSFTSSTRPITASSAFLMSMRFCGWTIWS